MKEIIEFRISNEYVHLILDKNEGKKNIMNTIVFISKEDPKFEKIRDLSKEIWKNYKDFLFIYSNISRQYTKNEIGEAKLFQLKINKTFEPAGEECGTLYDESGSCNFCGSDRIQKSILKLKGGSLPKVDISRTIAGEVIVSNKFKNSIEERMLKGVQFFPIEAGKSTIRFYQIVASNKVELDNQTIAGINIFDHSTECQGEIYKCPKGHTLGLNLLSEAFVKNDTILTDLDFFESEQKIGVNRGLLRPNPLYLCSPKFRKMILEEKLTGFDFEVANIV